MICQTLPVNCQLMRSPSSAAASKEMETEPAEFLVDSSSSSLARNDLPALIDGNSNTAWDNTEDERNVINGVADLFLQLQQQSSPQSPTESSGTPDDDFLGDIAAALPRKNGVTTALDIAALRKSLTGRPRLKRVCHICGRECPSRHKLQRHLSTHSEERPYHCSICGKAFKWTEYLSKHMRTQHGTSSPIIKPRIRHRSVNSPVESSSSVEPSSPKTRTCCHSSSHHQRSSSSSGSTTHDNGKKHSKSRRISVSTMSDSTMPTTPSDTMYSPNGQDSCKDSSSNKQHNGNMNASNSNNNAGMVQTDPFHFPFSANQYHANGYYPGFYPLNPYHPYLNAAAPYNFPHPFPNAMMQNYPCDPMMHGYMMDSSIGTDMMSNDMFDATGSSQSSHKSSVSCQTQDSHDQSSNSTKPNTKKRPTVKIINMTSKRDVGIQCEVGDETIRALYDEDGCYQDIGDCVSPGSNSYDDESCIICKYPCEENGCNRAYVHRKDLTRHMRIAHGSNPTVMEPRIVEAPVKPHICSIGDCNKSYYHMKDLRRHQRQCHLAVLTGAQGYDIDGISSLRYPCDFNGCNKSYIHKKDLIRHKRMFHNDGSNHPSIPHPVVVTHVKKSKRSSEERTSSSEPRETESKRPHLDSTSDSSFCSALASSSSPPCTPPVLSDVHSTTLMDSISAAVANMVSIEELSSQILNISPAVISSALAKDSEISATPEMLLESLSASPSSEFTSNGLLNDSNLLSTS